MSTTLTRDEILAVRPGQEMAFLVATRVMGWKPMYVKDGKFWQSSEEGTLAELDHYETERDRKACGWDPTTDLLDAWEVAQKVGIAFMPGLEIDNSGRYQWLAMPIAQWRICGTKALNEVLQIAVHGKTAPEVISKAALLTVCCVSASNPALST